MYWMHMLQQFMVSIHRRNRAIKTWGKTAWTGSYTSLYRPSLAHNMFAGNYDVKMAMYFTVLPFQLRLGYTGCFSLPWHNHQVWLFSVLCEKYFGDFFKWRRDMLNKVLIYRLILILVQAEELQTSAKFLLLLSFRPWCYPWDVPGAHDFSTENFKGALTVCPRPFGFGPCRAELISHPLFKTD